jgi:hypothetical protein
MKKNLLLLIAAGLIAIAPACHKGNSGGGSNEATLAVTTTPANGSNNTPDLGPDFALAVQITSTMPPGGVKIQVSSKIDGSSAAPFFSTSINSSSALNNFTITGTPSGTTCVVTITVTSVSNSGNVWNGSYRYSRK